MLTLVTLLGVLPDTVDAANIKAPAVSISNDADTGKVVLSWKKITGAVKYEIYRSTTKSGGYSCQSTTTSTTYTNTDAEVGIQYYYKVRAIAKNGSYATSKAVSRTCDLPSPVVTAGNSPSSGYPKLTWEAVEGAVSYKIYRSTSKSGSYSLKKATTSTTYTNTTAKVGVQYYYKVVAVAEKSAANSAYSAVKSRTCDLPRPVVTATNNETTGYPRLTWKAVSGAVSYKVYRSTSEDGTYTLAKTTTGTSYTNSAANPGNTYYYKVMAVAEKSAANSAYSEIKTRSCDLARPTASIALNSSGYPTLTWKAVEGATKYEVYRAEAETGEYTLLCTTIDTSYTNLKVNCGSTYYYKVRATCGNSDASSTYSPVVSIQANNEMVSNLRYVNLTSVYVYKATTSTSESLRLYYMVEVELGDVVKTSASGKWQEVYYKGELYYIWLTPDSDKLTEHKSTMEYTADTAFQQEVLDLAMTIYNEWSTRYIFGDVCVAYEDGTIGFDCSGFTTYVINTVMQKYAPAYRLTPQTSSMWNTHNMLNTGFAGEYQAIEVAWEDARLGDVVFFKSATTGELNHCGLYMGNNEFLHCTSAWEKGENPTPNDVGLMTLNDTYGDLVIGFKRFLPETVEPANAAFYAAKDCNIYSDCRCKEQVDLGLTAGDAVTVLYTRPTTNNTVVYIRTADDRYGFVWMSNLSAAE